MKTLSITALTLVAYEPIPNLPPQIISHAPTQGFAYRPFAYDVEAFELVDVDLARSGRGKLVLADCQHLADERGRGVAGVDALHAQEGDVPVRTNVIERDRPMTDWVVVGAPKRARSQVD
jgi:hypothetical protein